MQTFFPVTDDFTNPFFVATVVDNRDPTYNYRVKVRIQEVHDTITDSNLPWAGKLDSSFMGMDGSDISHSIPEIGSKVLCLAVGNNINSLLYIGTLYKKTSVTPTSGDYTGSYGIYRADGQFIGVDKINSVFKMLFSGDIQVDKVNNLSANIGNSTTINTGDSTTISSATSNTFKASTTTIDSSSTSITGTLDVSKDITGQAKATAELHSTNGYTGVFVDTFPGTSGSLTIVDGIIVGAGGSGGGGGGSSPTPAQAEALVESADAMSAAKENGMTGTFGLKSTYNTYRVDGNSYYYFTYNLTFNNRDINGIKITNGIITGVE